MYYPEGNITHWMNTHPDTVVLLALVFVITVVSLTLKSIGRTP
jgi:hypothetical protein